MSSRLQDPARRLQLLQQARLILLFSPDLCAPRDPMQVLEDVLPWIDVVQIRPKPLESAAPCLARDTYDWCARVLDFIAGRADLDLPVVVDDRVDVAAALLPRGCAGVHLGQDDCPVAVARRFLGEQAWIGLSTHDARQVGEAWDLPVDYLGFGPVHATSTKGYASGVGPEAAWIASQGSPKPLFPIGGIDAANAADLSRIGRAAVGSAILRADDPAREARELRSSLLP